MKALIAFMDIFIRPGVLQLIAKSMDQFRRLCNKKKISKKATMSHIILQQF